MMAEPLTDAPLTESNGLPTYLSITAALTSLVGSLSFHSSLLLADALTTGTDLFDDRILSVDPSSLTETLLFSASSMTPITGHDQEILRFHATIAADAAPPEHGTTGTASTAAPP